jgi:dephospho-CoA kinase
MISGKPIIGIAGGIGSGKSHIASLFAELGCAVIDSDSQVRAAYDDPEVRRVLREWWGPATFNPDGTVNRAAIAQRVFGNAAELKRLEGLVHPLVAKARGELMQKLAHNEGVVAFVWDTPLLLEAGLKDQCDAVVFVDAPPELRLERVARARGWNSAELLRRENLQWPLDRKREIADYVIRNTADAGEARSQVRDVLSRILARASQRPTSR